MSRLGTFVAAALGGAAGSALGGEIGMRVRGYTLPDALDEIVGAIVGGAIFAAVVSPPSTTTTAQAGVGAPRQVRMP